MDEECENMPDDTRILSDRESIVALLLFLAALGGFVSRAWADLS